MAFPIDPPEIKAPLENRAHQQIVNLNLEGSVSSPIASTIANLIVKFRNDKITAITSAFVNVSDMDVCVYMD